MKVKALTGFVLADGRSARTGEEIDLKPEIARDLQKVGIVDYVVERAVKVPKKEKRVVKEVKHEQSDID